MSNATNATQAESKSSSDLLEPSISPTLSRPSSRRTLRSSPSSNPLSAWSDAAPSSDLNSGQYAIYSSKKRSSVLGGGGSSIFSGSGTGPPTSSVAQGDGPLSSSASISSVPSTPPFAPTVAAPPLVSRPSSSSLPLSTNSRPHARSVSEAKEQLQKQALKSQLQGMGLSADSLGAALLGRLANLGEDAEWKGIQAALTSGKTTLLLPAEKQGSAMSLAPAFFLDHLILLDPSVSSTSSTPSPQGFATLSGLRGYMSTDELVFTSCGTALASTGKDNLGSEPVQRALRGAATPPSPPQAATYPSTMLISSPTSLSIPYDRSSSASQPTLSSRASTTSRLAALFGRPSPTLPPPGESGSDLPPVVPAPAGLFGDDGSSPTRDVSRAPSSTSSRKHGSSEVSVLAVGKAIRHAEVVTAIFAGVESQLRESSKSIPGVEGKAPVADQLVALAMRFQPSPTIFSSSTSLYDTSASLSSLYSADAETTSDAFQDAFHAIRLDLTRNLSASLPTDLSSSTSPSASAAPALEDFGQLEDRVDHSLELLEALSTSTLYDRLYAPPASRDWQDDENLVSRIAALNVLELDLEHLGLNLGEHEEGELEGWEGMVMGAKESLEELVGKVGKELDRLEDPHERTPAAKLAILVQCHALLVDGLSKLPPVPLKKELGDRDDRSSLLSDRPNEVEMDDASSRASSQPPSRPRSPTPTAEDELLKTPRPHSIMEEEVPEIQLPDSSLSPGHASGRSSGAGDMSSSVLEATSSSLFDPSPKPFPPTSVFESSRRYSGTSSPSTSSADLILPLLIYSVVRSNPPHLISHLNYVHRFRCDSLLRGQSSYCFTNFSAVVEFLTNIDVSALGISSQKIIAASPAPSPALSTVSTSSASSLFSLTGRPRAYTTGRIRGRVSQEIGSLAGTANTALAGVVDSSYRLIFSGARGAVGVVGGAAPRSLEDVKNVLEGARGRARESLPHSFRRSFSSRTLDEVDEASGAPSASGAGTGQREMVDITPTEPDGTPDAVSTADAYAPPPSATSAPLPSASSALPPGPPRHPDLSSRSASPTKSRHGKDDSDARSVRSISSLLKDTTFGRGVEAVRDGVAGVSSATLGGGGAAGGAGEERPSFLSGLPIPSLGRFGSGTVASSSGASSAASRRSTILNPLGVASASGPGAAEVHQRFLEVQSANELKVGEVQELLEGYRSLVKRVMELEAAASGTAAQKEERQAVDGAVADGEGQAMTV
ncbi:hypothetical protein JCM11251_003772 [Rhodosporidiobolus azoricus]